MAQSGMFRTAMGGFNKQDVLQYIDEITGAWNAERTALEQQAAEAADQRDKLLEQTQQSMVKAKEADQRAQVAETQLAEAQQQMYDATAELSIHRTAAESLREQLEEALRRVAQLEAEVQAVTDQRDEAIAAVADAKSQQNDTQSLTRQLEESHQQNRRLSDQIDSMQQAIARYEQVLGDVETAGERVSGIVRPFIEQSNRQADETLDSVQAVLAAVLAQLGELQGSVEQRRLALQRCKADSDSRLTAAFGDWLGKVPDTAPVSGNHFFR